MGIKKVNKAKRMPRIECSISNDEFTAIETLLYENSQKFNRVYYTQFSDHSAVSIYNDRSMIVVLTKSNLILLHNEGKD